MKAAKKIAKLGVSGFALELLSSKISYIFSYLFAFFLFPLVLVLNRWNFEHIFRFPFLTREAFRVLAAVCISESTAIALAEVVIDKVNGYDSICHISYRGHYCSSKILRGSGCCLQYYAVHRQLVCSYGSFNIYNLRRPCLFKEIGMKLPDSDLMPTIIKAVNRHNSEHLVASSLYAVFDSIIL